MERLIRCVGYKNGNPVYAVYATNIDIRRIGAVDKSKYALGAYEDKQEEGLLFEFPCKPGDTLYRIETDVRADSLEIEPYTIDNIVICKDGDILFKYDAYDGVICHLENITEGILYLDTYKVFLTEEQAVEYIQQRRAEEL